MARPFSWRRVACEPESNYFKPQGIPPRLATVYHRPGQGTAAQHEAERYEKYANLKDKVLTAWRGRQADPGRSGIEDRDAKK